MHLKEVATYVGHSNPATTLKYYNTDQAHVIDKVKALNAAAIIGQQVAVETKITSPKVARK